MSNEVISNYAIVKNLICRNLLWKTLDISIELWYNINVKLCRNLRFILWIIFIYKGIMIMKGKMRSTEIRHKLLSFDNIPSTLTIKDNVYCIQNGFCQNVAKIVGFCNILWKGKIFDNKNAGFLAFNRSRKMGVPGRKICCKKLR